MITHLKQSSQYQRYIQRQAEKDLRKQKTSQGELAIQIKRMFHSILMQEQLEEIAKETKFIKRNRELTPCALVAVLMIGCSGVQNVATLEVITSYLYEWFNIVMKPQSLQARLNNKEAVAFMKQVTTKVMMHEANKIMEKLLKKYLKKKSKNQLYKRILLQDSTVISLPESVARLFKGCGGSASKAAIKCDVIFDQQSHLIVRIKCVAGKVPDSSLSGDILEYLNEGDLVIRDLGYFNLENFANMFRNKINFISRLKKNVKIYLTENDENPLNLIEYLKTKGIRKKRG